MPATLCLSLGNFLGWVLAGLLLPVWCRGHRLLQHLDLVVLLPCQQLLHVIILILIGRAVAEVCEPHEESQQCQGGEEAEALSCHDPGGDYLRLRVPMPSPEEPAAAAGLRPINCSPSSPSHKVLRELQVTDESGGARGSMDASASEKCSEGG